MTSIKVEFDEMKGLSDIHLRSLHVGYICLRSGLRVMNILKSMKKLI